MPTTFSDLGVAADVVDLLSRRGIAEPFPIQTATMADALAGRDVCGRAPTGSGKTLAFGIPLASRVAKARPGRPRALVLVPTRELGAQVAKELAPLAALRGRTVMVFYGGVGYGPQLAALRKGPDIAVACPGRLADLVARKAIRLDDVDQVVVDEADRMADMGFLPEVRRLLDQVRPDRQTLLFSATLDGDVDVLIRRYQRDPVRHELAAAVDTPSNRHVFWRAERSERVALTSRVVGAEWPAIVFCRTRRGADRLSQQLTKSGLSAAAIHGDRSQGQRERALAAFAAGRVQALVATDIAARGIHVDGVACVVHFDPPADAKDYVHRSGRTGRAGATGIVLSLVGAQQAGETRKLQSKLGMPTVLHDPRMGALTEDEGPSVRTAPSPRRVEHARPAGSAPQRPRGAGAGRGKGRRPRRRPAA